MPGEEEEYEDIRAWAWRGKRKPVFSGSDMLRELCDLLYELDPDRFRRLPEDYKTVRKAWFSRDIAGMRMPYLPSDSGVYLDTNMSTVRKMQFSRELIRHFGFRVDEIDFETERRTK